MSQRLASSRYDKYKAAGPLYREKLLLRKKDPKKEILTPRPSSGQ